MSGAPGNGATTQETGVPDGLRSEGARAGGARGLAELAQWTRQHLAAGLRSFQREAVGALVGLVIDPDHAEYAEVLEAAECGEEVDDDCARDEDAARDEPATASSGATGESAGRSRRRGKRGGRRHRRKD